MRFLATLHAEQQIASRFESVGGLAEMSPCADRLAAVVLPQELDSARIADGVFERAGLDDVADRVGVVEDGGHARESADNATVALALFFEAGQFEWHIEPIVAAKCWHLISPGLARRRPQGQPNVADAIEAPRGVCDTEGRMNFALAAHFVEQLRRRFDAHTGEQIYERRSLSHFRSPFRTQQS